MSKTFYHFCVGDLVGVSDVIDVRSNYHMYASTDSGSDWISVCGLELDTMMVIDAFADVERNVFLTRVLVPSVGVRWISTCYLARA